MTAADRRPPLLAFGLDWTEGAPMARVLASAPPVPHTELPSPLPPPRFPLGAVGPVGLPSGAAAPFATRAAPASAAARG